MSGPPYTKTHISLIKEPISPTKTQRGLHNSPGAPEGYLNDMISLTRARAPVFEYRSILASNPLSFIVMLCFSGNSGNWACSISGIKLKGHQRKWVNVSYTNDRRSVILLGNSGASMREEWGRDLLYLHEREFPAWKWWGGVRAGWVVGKTLLRRLGRVFRHSPWGWYHNIHLPKSAFQRNFTLPLLSVF